MDVWAYDLEIFRNCCTAAFIDVQDYVQKCQGIEKLPYKEQLKIYKSVNRKLFVIYGERNDIAQLISFVNRNIYLVGFNSGRYDDIMIKYMIMHLYYYKSIETITSKLYDFSQEIINSQDDFSQYNWKIGNVKKCNVQFTGVDLMSAFGLNKVYKSLKQTSINIKWHNILDYKMPAPEQIEEEMGLYSHYENPNELEDWHRFVMPHHMNGIVEYNFNDSLVTAEMFRKKIKDIVLRMNITRKYNVNVISSSESDIADKIFTKLYCDRSGLTEEQYNEGYTLRASIAVKDCIPDTIKFQSPELQKLLSNLRDTIIVNTKGDMEFKVTFDSTTYTVATGGLHSKDTPEVFKSDDIFDYTDADAAAYYPWNVIHHKVHPEHLDCDIFLATVLGVVNDRTDSKPSGKNPDKTTDKTLKVVINSGIFGKMGFVKFHDNGNIKYHSPLYDPKALVSVTISGQLYLLMLIEMLSLKGFRCVSANTDGIIVKVEKARYEEYYAICKEWEKYTHFDLEYTYYSEYVCRDINNYFAVKRNDKDLEAIKHDPVLRAKFRKKYAKFKGDFNPLLYLEDLRKGFNRPIVAIAVADYFIFGTDVMTSIKDSKDIYDFCATQNIGKKFELISKVVINGKPDEIIHQRNSRWYVSIDGGYLYKRDKLIKDLTGIFKGFRTTIMNQYVEHDNMADYKLDYPYYYAEAMAIINKINAKSVKGIKRAKRAGNKLGIKKLNAAAKGLGQVGTLFD